MTFEELGLSDEILNGLDAMNFNVPTPVQEESIPIILSGHDLIACAQTGTGKTAAYVLPILDLLNKQALSKHINAVIMAPTRELVQQIDQQIQGFGYFVSVSAVPVYGGTDGDGWDVQRKALSMGSDIVIATPGRLLSHINLGTVDLSHASYFILDEADRMLDMGFYDDIMQVYRCLPKNCQVLMYSATMPPKIKKLTKDILKNPKEVHLAISKPPTTIIQTAYICHEYQKINLIHQLFKEKEPNRVLIFSNSKQKVKEITKTIEKQGFNVSEMHSDLEQSKREEVIRDFKNSKINVLVATDIVARGIDVDDIRVVINFDIPKDPEDYVHRIGRTARGTDGNGLAITLVSEEEQYGFKIIEDFLEKEVYKLPVPEELGKAPVYEPLRRKQRKPYKTKFFRKSNKK